MEIDLFTTGAGGGIGIFSLYLFSIYFKRIILFLLKNKRY
jgi:hypothetical protein